MTLATSQPILVVGYANVDVISRVPHLPSHDERVTASHIRLGLGGMAANCACAAASLGASVHFFGSVGQDPFAEIVVNDLERWGVNLAGLNRGLGPTTLAIIAVTPNGERSIISEPVSYDGQRLQTFLKTFQGHPGLLYVDGYHLGVAAAELALAKQHGFRLYCDLDGAMDTYAREDVLKMLPQLEYVQLRPTILHVLYPQLTEAQALLAVGTTVATVVQTNSSEDVLVVQDGVISHYPVPRIDAVVDTTGAGDIFAGTFLALLNQGLSLVEAARAAINRSALSIRYESVSSALSVAVKR
jgi:sulfofructose kinase